MGLHRQFIGGLFSAGDSTWKYWRLIMGKLRHLAMQVPDLERVAQTEAPIGDAICLSDGVMNLTLLQFPDGESGRINGAEWAGLHHFGFIVEDEEETSRKIKRAGGEYFTKLPEYPGVFVETKFKDPNGVVFDVATHDWPV